MLYIYYKFIIYILVFFFIYLDKIVWNLIFIEFLYNCICAIYCYQQLHEL